MIRLPTAVRLSLALVLMTASILFGADMLGLIPKDTEAVLAEREQICESLAVYCAVAAQKGDIPTVLVAMQVLVKHNEDILSTAVRREDGIVVAEAGDHGTNWHGAPDKDSTPTHVRVPILKGDNLWGTVEIAFRPIGQKGIAGILANTFVKLIFFVTMAGLLTYSFFLKRMLRHLDPSTVVPPRVKAALDTLTEGMILVNREERIVLANSSFGKAVDQSTSSLVGRKASTLNWIEPESVNQEKGLPWINAIRERHSQTGVRLGLHSDPRRGRTFMVNSAPILDTHGKCRGALATFSDVTKAERQNKELKMALEKLQKSRSEVRRKNRELSILATRDPLTNCLNRRSFFERFDLDFAAAKRYEYDLSLIMFDLDHFKSINDTHGHATGDKVLKGVSSIVQSLLRKTDVICRYGGEEFCILLPHTNIDHATQAAERFRLKIESHDFSGLSAAISLGVSSMSLGASEPSELVNQADQALYASKNGGRNRTTRWDRLGLGTERENSEFTREGRDAPGVFDNTVAAHEDTKLAAKGTNNAPASENVFDKAVGKGSSCTDRSKDALELVNDVLDRSAEESRFMGLNSSLSDNENAAVQVNQYSGWGDGGDIEEKSRLQESSFDQAVCFLKSSPTAEGTKHNG